MDLSLASEAAKRGSRAVSSRALLSLHIPILPEVQSRRLFFLIRYFKIQHFKIRHNNFTKEIPLNYQNKICNLPFQNTPQSFYKEIPLS